MKFLILNMVLFLSSIVSFPSFCMLMLYLQAVRVQHTEMLSTYNFFPTFQDPTPDPGNSQDQECISLSGQGPRAGPLCHNGVPKSNDKHSTFSALLFFSLKIVSCQYQHESSFISHPELGLKQQ